jgi:hypothetical protein
MKPQAILLGLILACACDRSISSPAASSAPTATSPPAPSPAPTPRAEPMASSSAAPTAARETTVTFDSEAVGGPPSSFEGVVGDWYIAEVGSARGLKVDGSKWRNGEPSANLADQAKRLYGDRYAEFLDGVKAFAFFPFAVWKSDPPAGDVRISVRFYPEAGKIDQAAGIAFAVAPDGTYLGARANALEDNILFFRVVKGKRTVIDTIRNVSTPSKTWHTFAIELRGKQLSVELDGKKRFQKTLDTSPSGRIGLWSKADSQVLFDDFAVTTLAPKEAP